MVSARGTVRAVLAVLAVLVGLGASACGGRFGGGGRGAAAADARITLYRDGAFVEETVEVDVAAGSGVVVLPRPLGVEVADLAVDALTGGVRVAGWAAAGEAEGAAAVGGGELVVQTSAAHAGRARLTLRYLSARIGWQASYTLIDEGGRGRLHAALALENRTGRRWQRARFLVVDRNMPSAAPTEAAFTQRVITVPGVHLVRPGAQRLDLGLAGALTLRPTLVYDPVGTRLDSATLHPQRAEAYGVERWPAAVDESVLIDLSQVADGALPSGLVRVFTVGRGGALVWRGEGRLLPPADDAERYTTVAVGRSVDVTGARRRTDYHLDLERRRLVEEITVTLHNAGDRAADVLVREHLYRGQCWSLAFQSTERVAKEGFQQIGLGVTVPAGGDATVMYRVVYEWDDRICRRSKSRT